MRAKQLRQSSEIQQDAQRLNNRMHKDLNELWKDGFAEGVAGGRGGCAPSYSVDSCLQWSNGVWWVEVLSYHVFLSSSGMYCLTISSA